MKKTTKLKSVGARIKSARKTYRMSQAALGENLAVTRAAISQYEKDITTPREEVMLRLAAVFNTEPEWFRYGRGLAPQPHDVPVVIPEIDITRLTAKVLDLRNLKTGRHCELPMAAFEGGLAIAPDHMVAILAPTSASPLIHEGDIVFVDARRHNGPPGVYLVLDEKKGACLRRMSSPDGMNIHPDGSTVYGRAAAFFRTI